ncbi:hypothetical protein [uncultured Leptotrichia sp.]|uniref:hypothetical protein n=1 Tax=uncultured Leptotrichia sp. TaxID=159271 RepID=UPI0025F22636|nr:hypothetical protein [uncultured Leptotrichia sp.]
MKQKVELVIINIIKVYFDFCRLFISDIPWQYINSNKIYIYANKINRNNRFSEKSFSEDFYNIIIEKITFIKEKDYPIVFSMIKEKLKKQIKDKELLKEMKIAGKYDFYY